MKRLLGLLAWVALSLGPTVAQAQPFAVPPPPPWAIGGQSRDEYLVVSLVTFGPGTEVNAWFGHTALVVEDRLLQRARLYNYGLFIFDATMLLRFASGRLEFWVGEAPVGATIDLYREEGRDIRVQVLNLLPSERGRLARLLAENVLPQNAQYLYDHYHDNCSTRPRDIIDKAVNGQLVEATSSPSPFTLRQETQRYTAVNPVMSVLLDFWMNADIDRPMPVSGAAFLPEELERQLEAFQYVNADGVEAPMVAKSVVLSRSGRPHAPDLPPRYERPMLLMGLGLGTLLLAGALWERRRGPGVGRWVRGATGMVIGLAFGIPGLIGALFWLFTNHTITYRNENLLLASPLTLLAVPWGWRLLRHGDPRAARRLDALWWTLAVLALMAPALKWIPHAQQDNGRILAIGLPILVASAVSGWLRQRES